MWCGTMSSIQRLFIFSKPMINYKNGWMLKWCDKFGNNVEGNEKH